MAQPNDLQLRIHFQPEARVGQGKVWAGRLPASLRPRLLQKTYDAARKPGTPPQPLRGQAEQGACPCLLCAFPRLLRCLPWDKLLFASKSRLSGRTTRWEPSRAEYSKSRSDGSNSIRSVALSSRAVFLDS